MTNRIPVRLIASGVSGGYHKHSLVCHNIDLTCASGDFLAILGPNGSGKTTLLRILIGSLTPKTGEVLLNGRPLAAWTAKQKSTVMAIVPQQASIVFPFSVAEVVMLGRMPYRHTNPFDNATDREIAACTMREMGVLQIANKPFHECSGGEQKRALIARALAQQPEVLLLDEPAAGLDLHHQVALYEILARLCQKSGLATLIVSHDPWLPTQACTRALLLKEGRVICQGAPHTVLTASNLASLYGVTMIEAYTALPSLPTIAVPCIAQQLAGG